MLISIAACDVSDALVRAMAVALRKNCRLVSLGLGKEYRERGSQLDFGTAWIDCSGKATERLSINQTCEDM